MAIAPALGSRVASAFSGHAKKGATGINASLAHHVNDAFVDRRVAFYAWNAVFGRRIRVMRRFPVFGAFPAGNIDKRERCVSRSGVFVQIGFDKARARLVPEKLRRVFSVGKEFILTVAGHDEHIDKRGCHEGLLERLSLATASKPGKRSGSSRIVSTDT